MSARRWGLLALALLIIGAGLTWWGFGDDVAAARVLGIVGSVLGLAALRARAWIRKVRVLTEVGRDLHVPDRDE